MDAVMFWRALLAIVMPKVLKIRVDELWAYEFPGEYAFKGAQGELCVVHSDNILAIRDAEESDG